MQSWIKRSYERIDVDVPDPVVGTRVNIEEDRPHAEGWYWQYLLPLENTAFDMYANILCFETGNYFPHVELHIVQHCL